MTTYTISKDQLKALIEGYESGDVLKYVPALSLLRHLQPNTQEPEAEVLWYDPMLYDPETNPYKRIDAPMSFMESAPLGTKLYTHPAPQAKPLTAEQINDLMQEADAKWSDADVPMHWARHFARAIEAAHNIGVKP